MSLPQTRSPGKSGIVSELALARAQRNTVIIVDDLLATGVDGCVEGRARNVLNAAAGDRRGDLVDQPVDAEQNRACRIDRYG